VLLIDEVEKAHADVLNVLLQVLDDGRLTDAKGRTVNFANTILIMTSNLGAQHLLEAAAARQIIQGNDDATKRVDTEAKTMVMKIVRQFFRPEFLNRLDDIVVFDPLSKDMLRSIAHLASIGISQRLAKKGIALEWNPSALDLAAKESYDPAFGARPLRRWLERRVVTDLSYKLIAGEIGEGSKVVVGADGKDLTYALHRMSPQPNPAKRVKMSSGRLDDIVGRHQSKYASSDGEDPEIIEM
jgi:ATP-dependent Clp protease ATP-binding subunit ClpB